MPWAICTHFTHIDNETRNTVFIAETGSERHIKVNGDWASDQSNRASGAVWSW